MHFNGGAHTTTRRFSLGLYTPHLCWPTFAELQSALQAILKLCSAIGLSIQCTKLFTVYLSDCISIQCLNCPEDAHVRIWDRLNSRRTDEANAKIYTETDA